MLASPEDGWTLVLKNSSPFLSPDRGFYKAAEGKQKKRTRGWSCGCAVSPGSEEKVEQGGGGAFGEL